MVERKCLDPEIETAPPEINRGRQTEKLKALVKRVYENTVFYRRRFDEAGIKPEDIQTLEDLQRIPPTRYLEDFVGTPVEDKLAVPIDKVVLVEVPLGYGWCPMSRPAILLLKGLGVDHERILRNSFARICWNYCKFSPYCFVYLWSYCNWWYSSGSCNNCQFSFRPVVYNPCLEAF